MKRLRVWPPHRPHCTSPPVGRVGSDRIEIRLRASTSTSHIYLSCDVYTAQYISEREELGNTRRADESRTSSWTGRLCPFFFFFFFYIYYQICISFDSFLLLSLLSCAETAVLSITAEQTSLLVFFFPHSITCIATPGGGLLYIM